jgi:hypothetical protein
MDRIREEFAAARPPVTSSITTVDENGYSGWAFLNGNGTDIFNSHAEKSSYKRPAESSSEEKTEHSNAEHRDWLNEQMLLQGAESRKVFQEIMEDAQLEKEDENRILQKKSVEQNRYKAAAATEKMLGAYEANFVMQDAVTNVI